MIHSIETACPCSKSEKEALQAELYKADHAGRYGETIVESMYRQEADKQRRKADAMKDAAIWELVQ